jgi:hypothetical protein
MINWVKVREWAKIPPLSDTSVRSALVRGLKQDNRTCCGVVELTGIFDDKRLLGRALSQDESLYRQRLVVYYGVHSKLNELLIELGFIKLTEFYNKNSGNTVSLLVAHPATPNKEI